MRARVIVSACDPCIPHTRKEPLVLIVHALPLLTQGDIACLTLAQLRVVTRYGDKLTRRAARRELAHRCAMR